MTFLTCGNPEDVKTNMNNELQFFKEGVGKADT